MRTYQRIRIIFLFLNIIFTYLYSSQSYPYDVITSHSLTGDLKPGTVSDSYIGHNYVENEMQGTFKAPDITYEGFVPCSPPKCAKVYTSTSVQTPTTETAVEQETYKPIDYTGETIHGTLVEYNPPQVSIDAEPSKSIGKLDVLNVFKRIKYIEDNLPCI